MNKIKLAEKHYFNVYLKFWRETVKESLSGRAQAAEAFKLRGSPLTSGCDTFGNYTEKERKRPSYCMCSTLDWRLMFIIHHLDLI